MPVLKAALADRGLALTDLRHLLLSHIHLDHAGAAGTLVREHPGLRVHVSEIGAPHVVDPSPARGERAAALRRRVRPPLGRARTRAGRRTSRSSATASSASTASPRPATPTHHVCYLHADGTLYAGDAAGVRIQPSPIALPVCPPPDVDVEGWFRTFDEIERRQPERLALIHFGVADVAAEHLASLREHLASWAERGREGLDQEAWVAAARHDLEAAVGEDEADHWERAAPLWQSYSG